MRHRTSCLPSGISRSKSVLLVRRLGLMRSLQVTPNRHDLAALYVRFNAFRAFLADDELPRRPGEMLHGYHAGFLKLFDRRFAPAAMLPVEHLVHPAQFPLASHKLVESLNVLKSTFPGHTATP